MRGIVRHWKLGLLVLCVLAVMLYQFAGMRKTGPMRPMGEAAPVRVAGAVVQDVPFFLQGIGSVVPSSDVLIRSRVNGELMKIHFTEGQRVRAGDLLAEIDPRPFEAALHEARGKLAADMAQLENAKLDLARYANLVRKDYIERQKYDNQKALVTQLEGAVFTDRAACENARLQLEYSRIKAPAAGIAGLRKVDVGNQITASDSEGIVRISEVSPCDVVFTLPETNVARVVRAFAAHETRNLPVQAWDREQKELLARGTLLSLDNAIDSATGTIKIKARFPNEDRILYPNQFVNVRLCVDVFRGAVTIPPQAVQIGSRGTYVYVVSPDGSGKGGTVSVRNVTTMLETPRLAVVTGIKAGEQVVVDGVDRLREGARVVLTATVPVQKAEEF